MHPGDEGRRVPARRRRRRTPEVAEREIIAAAEALLRERPFRELTVDEVMRRTDLSRPSFYVYFRDRHHLVLRVVEYLGAELFEMSDRWMRGNGDGADLARQALQGIVGVYAEHGHVMRALASDAFFPFSDGPQLAFEAGVTAVIQPGGSVRDHEVVQAADAAGISMVFTGRRHFRH